MREPNQTPQPLTHVAARRLSKRAWLRLSAALGGPALLAACVQGPGRQDQAPAAPSAGPVTIRHMPWNATKDIQAPQDVAEMFAAKQKRITVQVEPPGGDIYQKLDTLLAADQEPDTFYLQGWTWQPYAVRGAALDLTPLIRNDRGFPAGAVFPKPHQEQTNWQDRTYMVPNDTGGFVLFFNKDLFDRAGLGYPNERWTWDDWFKASERLTSGEGDAKVYGYEAQTNWRRNSWWIKQAGKEAWDRIVGPTKSALDDPLVIDTVQRQVDMVHRYRYSPVPGAQGVNIYTGRTAMKVEGDWTMWTYRQDQRIRWDVAPLPRHKQRATVLLVHGSSASARTKQKDAAWEWLKFYTTEDAQRAHVIATGRVAITPELAKKIFLPFAKSEFGAEHPEVFLTRWDHGSHFGITDVLADVEKEAINPAFTTIFKGEQAVAPTLREAARKANEILKSSRMAAR
ncbi:MAG: sugar ABC transporter substrate-binding protein [Chloroflexi bacterium]|nr:sugar ABC transporter substrate-binding protein [Chloroflexota bacterium]